MIEVVFDEVAGELEEGTIQNWFFEEGDTVSEGEELAEIATENGTVIVRAPASGVLAEVYYDEGEAVGKGEVLCTIDDAEGGDLMSDN